MAKTKRNYYMEEETHDAISRLSDQRKLSNGDFISELVDLYENGELLRTKIETEQLSLLRTTKKMISDMYTNQAIEMNVLNTICEINDYSNFVSIDEQKSVPFAESEKHVQQLQHAKIIKQLEDQKAQGQVE